MTYDRLGGEYFTAYYELIKGINPETHRSREISPHIDRQWHIITKMPDLDESNQKLQEYDIYAAFFWAVINGYVEQKDEGGIKIYKLNNIRLKMDDDTLVVSNGTDCDKLYEVLDAIAIYPELIDKILSKVDQITQYDLNSSFDLEEGFLFKSLNTFEIKEPGIGKENKSSKCIFDIPMLMKKSVTPDIYYEDNVIEMLEVIINEVKKYISNFIPEKKLPEVFGKIVIDQFEKHLESVALESEIQSTIYQESLFGKVSDTIITLLEDIGLRYEASELNDKVFELRNN